MDLSDRMLTAGVLAWVSIVGAVSFEVFGQYGPDTFTNPEQLLRLQVAGLSGLLGLS